MEKTTLQVQPLTVRGQLFMATIDTAIKTHPQMVGRLVSFNPAKAIKAKGN